MLQLNTDNTRKNTTFSTLLSRFTKVHGNKYTYSKAVFDGMMTKILITCPVHGDFEQLPMSHAKGKGCYQCGTATAAVKHIKLTKTDILTIASKYTDAVTFRHEEEQAYRIAARRFGKEFVVELCKSMDQKYRRKDTKSFNLEMDDGYELQSEYINSQTYVNILHSPCGNVYKVKPYHYSNGSRCPTCAKSGFSKTMPGILYYFKVTYRDIIAYKIGVTNASVKERYCKYERDRISEVYTLETSGVTCYELEQLIIKGNSDVKYVGIPILHTGNTELFTVDILDKIKEQCEKKIGQTIQKDTNWNDTDM